MSQLSFSDAEYAGKRKKARREVFLEEMGQVVPWQALLKVIGPFYPQAVPDGVDASRTPDAELVCPQRSGDAGSTV